MQQRVQTMERLLDLRGQSRTQAVEGLFGTVRAESRAAGE
jgi:hypothetical protein